MRKRIILGGGPSGLSCAVLLKEKTLILEKESNPGGHASSFTKDGFTFDYGPHILFSKDKEILEFIVKSLGKNVEKCRRNNKISINHKLIKYPFENAISSSLLPSTTKDLDSFLNLGLLTSFIRCFISLLSELDILLFICLKFIF